MKFCANSDFARKCARLCYKVNINVGALQQLLCHMKKASTYETCLEHAFLFTEIFKQKNFQHFHAKPGVAQNCAKEYHQTIESE